ncbi:MAG: hypothetical protein AMDU5_GPLC00004G0296 [Thermoplasmatales archaeon Gpl]|nr:MAG: hypothetical protein AMDU5_GPLC00004G0296 [Thermoplasmatales archaeon Gpl]
MSELVDVNWDAGCQEIIRAIVIMNANYRLRHTVHTGDLYSFFDKRGKSGNEISHVWIDTHLRHLETGGCIVREKSNEDKRKVELKLNWDMIMRWLEKEFPDVWVFYNFWW